MINRGYLFQGIRFGGRVYADLRWQPYINRATDTQTHGPVESDSDRFPFLLLNAPVGGGTDVTVIITGSGTTASTGSVTITGDALTIVTGTGITNVSGSVVIVAGAVITPTGISTTASTGSVEVLIGSDALVDVAGYAVTAAAGSVVVIPAIDVDTTGLAVTMQSGTVTIYAEANETILVTGSSIQTGTGYHCACSTTTSRIARVMMGSGRRGAYGG